MSSPEPLTLNPSLAFQALFFVRQVAKAEEGAEVLSDPTEFGLEQGLGFTV